MVWWARFGGFVALALLLALALTMTVYVGGR